MRRKKAFLNIATALLLEIITLLVGLVVPRLIIGAFGSATNGLVNSITQFLGYIALLQSGVGSVIRAALYKPLAQKDHHTLCVIVKTAENFFKKIGYATIAYIIVLSAAFPTLFAQQYDSIFTTSLVIIIGISTVAQYLWGITYQMVLEADQCAYVYLTVQIITVVLNAICTVALINFGCSIQVVKLASSALFVLRPIIVNLYSKKKYKLISDIEIDNNLIAQRWDGMAQAIAYFIHTKTDVFVLTILSTLENVSIYSVYMLITNGLTSLINCVDKAIRAVFGNIIAKQEGEALKETFDAYSLSIHILSTICFSTACVTVFGFVKVYTHGITDAEYIQPLFGTLIISAEYLYCLRMPYNAIINAAGKFRETKHSAYIEAILNIVISLLFVHRYGLVGVAIGTLSAMLYRSISFIRFLHRDTLHLKYSKEVKRYMVSFILYFGMVDISKWIQYSPSNYFNWILFAGIVFLCISFIVLGVFCVVDFASTKVLYRMVLGKKTKS